MSEESRVIQENDSRTRNRSDADWPYELNTLLLYLKDYEQMEADVRSWSSLVDSATAHDLVEALNTAWRESMEAMQTIALALSKVEIANSDSPQYTPQDFLTARRKFAKAQVGIRVKLLDVYRKLVALRDDHNGDNMNRLTDEAEVARGFAAMVE